MTKLYTDDRGEKPEVEYEPTEFSILTEDIKNAARKMQWRNAEGEDGVVIEMVEAGGEHVVKKITDLVNKICNSGYIPETMKEAVFITIPKKEGAMECEKPRTISIISQLIFRVIRERILNKVTESLDAVQLGFRKGKRTRNAIFFAMDDYRKSNRETEGCI